MNRRGFFGRVTGLVAGAVAASAVKLPAAESPPRAGLNLSERDIQPDSLLIQHYENAPQVCDFKTRYRPDIGSNITIRFRDDIVFSGFVTQTVIRSDSDVVSCRAQDRWGQPFR